ncbi:MAG: hypothetical protein M3453_13885 [Pseudomonadota bacterium]|nr:hypothetical protein [Pseudomonadota bacterium]
MPKLILHAGVHRTGTTSIQQYLAHNRQALADQGFAYTAPKDNHQELAWKLLKDSITPDEFADAIHDSEGRDVIVSAEDMCRIVDGSLIARIAARFDTQVILFVRRQDDWVESWYNQNVKWPFNRPASVMSPLEFLGTLPEYHWLYYDTLYFRWREASPKVELVLFDEVQDSVQEFCRRIGIDQSLLVQPARKANSSLSAGSLEIVRHLGMAALSPQTRMAVLRSLNAAAFTSKHPTPVFPASVKNLIMERFYDSNRRISQEILGRLDAELFPPAEHARFVRRALPDGQTLLGEFVAPLLRSLDRRSGRKE